MKIEFKAIASFTVTAVSLLLLGSCTSNPDSSGLEYMPDMYRSPAIEPYVDYGEVRGSINETAKNSLSAMTPPSGTIPYYGTDSATVAVMLPYARKANLTFRETHGLYGADLSTQDEYALSAADVNPIKLTPENSEEILKKGKELYTYMCQHCHGEKGDGNGPMVVSGAYAGPANLTTLAIPEGQMFYSIYYGRNAMGSHSSQMNKKEIWTVIHYLKKFQNPAYGTANAATTAPAADTLTVSK